MILPIYNFQVQLNYVPVRSGFNIFKARNTSIKINFQKNKSHFYDFDKYFLTNIFTIRKCDCIALSKSAFKRLFAVFVLRGQHFIFMKRATCL